MVSKSLSKACLALLICPRLDIHEKVILTTCGPNERFESKSRPRSLAEGTGISYFKENRSKDASLWDSAVHS